MCMGSGFHSRYRSAHWSGGGNRYSHGWSHGNSHRGGWRGGGGGGPGGYYEYGNESSYENYTYYYVNGTGGEWNSSEVVYVTDSGVPVQAPGGDNQGGSVKSTGATSEGINQWLLQHLVPLKSLP